MTQASERTATLSQMVAEEIRALMARRRMSGRQLAVELGVSPSWVSYRLTGAQPIDVNDLMLISRALGVGVHDLLPPPNLAATARTGHSRLAGTSERGGDLNASLRQLARSEITLPPIGAPKRHPVPGRSPMSPQRRDSIRPVSVIPATQRRPARMGPGRQPMAS
jgi:transcriptional regulator with XRE-family HTH domain